MSERGVSDDVPKEIGRVVVEFQGLESEIQWLVQLLAPVPQRFGQIITAELPLKGLCHLASSLSHELHADKPEMERVRELVGRALGLEAKRNEVVHSLRFAGRRLKTTAKHKHGIRSTSTTRTPINFVISEPN